MSVTIWYGTGGDDALSLGDPAILWRLFGEISRKIQGASGYEELESVPGFAEQEVTPWWMQETQRQAEAYLRTYGPSSSPAVKRLLESLIRQIKQAKVSDSPPTAEQMARPPVEESEEDDPGQALAVWYARVLTALEAAGQDVDGEAERIEEELGGTGWAVVRGRGAWHAVHEMEDAEDAPEQMAAGGERAPKGGIVLNGRHYRGGQFIPGKEIAKASPEDRQRLEQAKVAAAGKQAERTNARKARGSVDHGKLVARLQQHAQAHPLDGLQRRQAASMASLLHRHHGELALHRVEELADRLEQALQSIDEDHPNADGLRKNLGEQLARLHQAAQAIQGKGVTGEVKGEVTPPTSAATPPTADTHASLARAFLAHLGAQDNLVSLADLQGATGLSREQLHAAVQDLRRRGLVTLSGSEGRHAAEQSATGEKERRDRDAAIDEDGRKLAYLSVRGDQEDAFGALAQAKQSSEKSDVPALQRPDSGTIMPSGGEENPSGGQAMTKELPKLAGSEKQVAWAEKIRAEKIAQAEGWLENARKALADPVHADYRDHYAKEVAELEAALEYAHTVTSASQWIDWRRDKLRQMAKEAGAIPAAKSPAAQEGTPQDLIQKLIDADDRYQKAAFTAGEEEAFKEREKVMRALQGMSRRELLQHARDMNADEIRLLRLHSTLAKLPKDSSDEAPTVAQTGTPAAATGQSAVQRLLAADDRYNRSSDASDEELDDADKERDTAMDALAGMSLVDFLAHGKALGAREADLRRLHATIQGRARWEPKSPASQSAAAPAEASAPQAAPAAATPATEPIPTAPPSSTAHEIKGQIKRGGSAIQSNTAEIERLLGRKVSPGDNLKDVVGKEVSLGGQTYRITGSGNPFLVNKISHRYLYVEPVGQSPAAPAEQAAPATQTAAPAPASTPSAVVSSSSDPRQILQDHLRHVTEEFARARAERPNLTSSSRLVAGVVQRLGKPFTDRDGQRKVQIAVAPIVSVEAGTHLEGARAVPNQMALQQIELPVERVEELERNAEVLFGIKPGSVQPAFAGRHLKAQQIRDRLAELQGRKDS